MTLRSFFSAILAVCFCLSSCDSGTTNMPENSSNVDSTYITDVFEYVYAPGQHASLATSTDVQYFIGNPNKYSPGEPIRWLYLGGFGGYVVAGFNHNIENKDGYDFEVFSLPGAMPEPAVVYVMCDENADGKPNETWYELKGNQFENSQRDYWVRYYKAVSDEANITWMDSDGERGELISGFGSTSSAGWWWNETTTDSITLTGVRLPDAYEKNTDGRWVVPQEKYTYGYAENMYGEDYDKTLGSNKFDVSNAVDANGNEVILPHIRFIKIQTAVFQQAGSLNEISAEIRGAGEIK